MTLKGLKSHYLRHCFYKLLVSTRYTKVVTWGFVGQSGCVLGKCLEAELQAFLLSYISLQKFTVKQLWNAFLGKKQTSNRGDHSLAFTRTAGSDFLSPHSKIQGSHNLWEFFWLSDTEKQTDHAQIGYSRICSIPHSHVRRWACFN